MPRPWRSWPEVQRTVPHVHRRAESTIEGADDTLVPAEIVAADESRWAEYNRKFNEIFRPAEAIKVWRWAVVEGQPGKVRRVAVYPEAEA